MLLTVRLSPFDFAHGPEQGRRAHCPERQSRDRRELVERPKGQGDTPFVISTRIGTGAGPLAPKIRSPLTSR